MEGLFYTQIKTAATLHILAEILQSKSIKVIDSIFFLFLENTSISIISEDKVNEMLFYS